MVFLRITENICFPVGCFCLKPKKPFWLCLQESFFFFPCGKKPNSWGTFVRLGYVKQLCSHFSRYRFEMITFSFVGLRLFCFQQDKKAFGLNTCQALLRAQLCRNIYTLFIVVTLHRVWQKTQCKMSRFHRFDVLTTMTNRFTACL